MSGPQTLVRGTMDTDALMLFLEGRRYGTFLKPADRLAQGVPDFLGPLVLNFQQQSKLLELEPANSPDHDAIFDAYKADVTFLQGRLDGFERMVRSAVASSIKYATGGDTITYVDGEDGWGSARRRTKTKDWDTIKANIPQMDNVPLIDLSAERAALPAEQLLTELKAEVNAGIDRLLRRACFWLDELVDQEYIGLVEFTGPTVGHYYYFRPFVTEEMIGRKVKLDTTEDPSQPFGSRVTYRTEEGRTYRVTENLERHDHHIVRAGVDTLVDFQQQIPNRIIENLLNDTPAWLRPHLRVVSGEITKEEIRRRVVRQHEETEQIVSVWKGSPAIVIGPYALAGWSADDLGSGVSSFWRDRRVLPKEIVEATQQRRSAFKRVALTVGGLGTLLYGAYLWIDTTAHRSFEQSRAAYQTYRKAYIPGHKVYTVRTGRSVTLPRDESLYFFGTDRMSSNLKQPIFSTAPEAWRSNSNWAAFGGPNSSEQLTDTMVTPAYGTINLTTALGIPAKLNILSIDDDQVTFTVDYQNSGGK